MRHIFAHWVLKLVQSFRGIFYRLLSNASTRGRVEKNQPVLMLGRGVIAFEDKVKLGYFPSPFFLNGYIHLEARGTASSVKVGEGTHINNNFVAIAEHASIVIGKRCLFGTHVEIYDSDFHGLAVADRGVSDPAQAKSVLIGDDVFVGSNVKIMKGVEIGDGSVIANGAVVVGKIPANVLAGGNPAKVLRVI